MGVTVKTQEEHRQYLYDIVRLKLFFLHRYLHGHPEETFVHVLRNRVDIYRKLDCNVGLLNPSGKELDFERPSWRHLESTLEQLYVSSGEDVSRFEEEGFQLLRPAIDRRVNRDWLDVSRINGYQCGSLRYNVYPEGEHHEVIGFHIGNALQPFSMFADPQYLCGCFAELMRQTSLKYGSTILHTGTWLNSLPKWLAYFPQEYLDSLSEPFDDIQWHYGYWGQFITSRGVFNQKYGEILRMTGKFPYLPRIGECSFAAMRRHLKDRFGFDCPAEER